MSYLHAARDQIVMILLALSPEDRVSVLDAVRHNEYFCQHCGQGDVLHPNMNCRCRDDE